MIRVKLSTNSPNWPFARQTPGGLGVWGDFQFFIDEAIDECDFWVVYDDVLRPETTRCPPENTLLITGEPPSVKLYPRRFAAQFQHILTCQRGLKHPRPIYRHQALPWHVLTETYDILKAGNPEKTKPLSIISSDKAFTEGHRKRLEFTQKLKARLGPEIEYFGHGVRAAKYDATAPFRYSVVIENSSYADYWTEKLADAFLLDAYPFYYGCPNVLDYFPKNALTIIDISDFEAAVTLITTAMKNDAYGSTKLERQNAKELVLEKYNLFAVLADLIPELSHPAPSQPVTLLPNRQFPLNPVQAVKNVWKRAVTEANT